MHRVIFTFYSAESSNRFTQSMRELASNLDDADSTELVIMSKSTIPKKIANSISSRFGKVSHVKPSIESTTLSTDCLSDVVLKYNSYDRWFVDPRVIITSQLPSNPDANLFYCTETGLISTGLMFLKNNTALSQIFRLILENRRPAYTISKEEFTHIVTNNFAIDKIVSRKLVRTFLTLKDQDLLSNDCLTDVIALDTSHCLGKNYSSLDEKLEQFTKKPIELIAKKRKSTLVKSTISDSDSIVKTSLLQKPPIVKKVTNESRVQGRVTILMTNYNCSEYIGETIESVIAQTYSNWELLIADDFSTDSSLSIISKYASVDPRIKLFLNNKNVGTYYSKNCLLTRSTGEYVTCLDSDDLDVNTKLEEQVAVFEQDDSIVCVRCNYERSPMPGSSDKPKISLGYASAMFRSEVFDTIGFYDSVKFGADSEFFDRIIKTYGKPAIFHINKILQLGPTRETGLTSVVPIKHAARLKYVESYRNWHKTMTFPYIEFPLAERPFLIDRLMTLNSTSDFNQEQVTDFSKYLIEPAEIPNGVISDLSAIPDVNLEKINRIFSNFMDSRKNLHK